MTSEHFTVPPQSERNITNTVGTEINSTEEVKYDDFGLPLRKRRPRTPVEDSSNSEEETFQDVLALTPAPREIEELQIQKQERSRGWVKGRIHNIEKREAGHDEKAEDLQRMVDIAVEKQKWGPTVSKEKYDGQEEKAEYVRRQVDIVEEKKKWGTIQDKEKFEEISRENTPCPTTPQKGTLRKATPRKNTLKDERQEEDEVEFQQEAAKADVNMSFIVEPVVSRGARQIEEIVESTEKVDKIKEGKSEPIETPEIVKQRESTKPVLLPIYSPTPLSPHRQKQSIASVSEYSHQQIMAEKPKEESFDDIGDWQTMPSYARYDMYDDDNKLIAKENTEALEDMSGYANVGGAAKGYTRVDLDDDAQSQTSMDDNTAYLFKERNNGLTDEDDETQDSTGQMQTTKNLLNEGQRVAYVGLVRLATIEMEAKFARIERNKRVKKLLDLQGETTKMWSQKVMFKLYEHMDISTSEQIMIEQLSEHGVVPADLTPALMANARIKNPVAVNASTRNDDNTERSSSLSPELDEDEKKQRSTSLTSFDLENGLQSPPPPPYDEEQQGFDYPDAKSPSEFPTTKNIDIDLRWTVLCDLFLALIADAAYDSRSRELLQQVGKYLSVDWIEICRFEKRVTDALEMQEQADKENWNEDDHLVTRAKRARNKRLAFVGLATVGGGLVIGLSAGLLAPLIGAGLAAGFTTIGVAGTSSFLAGAGGAAIVTSTGVVTGTTIGMRAANRRTGSVKTFEYRPLHNNKRTHLIITVAGWMNGKVDDVRLPYSTVDPVMGDIYSVLWEPEMLRSMGDTINILATEALTQGLQQVLASTILTALMAAMTLPLALTKLSYLIDNPWIVSQARADMAGLILADSLIDRNLGTRPVTLVGFSLGSRVIYSCLKELAKRGAFGVVQNVYMFGTPAVAKYDEYVRARAIVPGRFVNGYATNDWILSYLFRATSGGVLRVAGLAPVEIPTIENVNVTELVPGHMAYRAAMPKLLREVGWLVTSDEFTEIEDPDPENHEKRQRELINEIEEARKELGKKATEKEKKGSKLSWWKKKKVDKKGWEVYDESSTAPPKTLDREADPAVLSENHIMFDVDAIRKEVAALAAESKEYNTEVEFEIKEIKSTLPPMKIGTPSAPVYRPSFNHRASKSCNDDFEISNPDSKTKSLNNTPATNGTRSPFSTGQKPTTYDEYDEYDDGEHMEMTFDTSFHNSPSPSPASPPRAISPLSSYSCTPDLPASPWNTTPKPNNSWDTTPGKQARSPQPSAWTESTPDRPTLQSAKTTPESAALNSSTFINPGYNAWADEFEDEFGHEREVKMSFM